MHADRLIKLAELLEADAANPKGIKFDLAEWGESEDGALSISCGTQACAMGLAVLSGEFSKFGLKNGSGDPKFLIHPLCNERGGFGAASELFGIETWEAYHLFSMERYPDGSETTGAAGELMVARRIREFVADNQPADTTI